MCMSGVEGVAIIESARLGFGDVLAGIGGR